MPSKLMPIGDLCYGVQAIADHIGLRRRQAQHLVDVKTIPTFRIGKIICANRSTLTAWLAAREAESGKAGTGD